jgi:hypothetical protein
VTVGEILLLATPPFTPHPPVGAQKIERCPICAKSITSGEVGTKNTCGAWRCNTIYRQQQLDLRRQKSEQFQQEYDHRLAQATEVRDVGAKADGIEVPDSYLTIMVPVNKNRLARIFYEWQS